LNLLAGMASTAAMVFFCCPVRISLRASLTGFLVGVGLVCAIADEASNSKVVIRIVFFILPSFLSRRIHAQKRYQQFRKRGGRRSRAGGRTAGRGGEEVWERDGNDKGP